jgi:D-xylulose reductase
MPFAATPPTDGTLTKYYQMPADFAYPVPDSMSLEDAAMVRSCVNSLATLADASSDGAARRRSSCYLHSG